MKKLLFVTSLAFATNANAQIQQQFGLLLGLTASQFNQQHTVTNFVASTTESTRSIISPVLGVSSNWKIKKHLQLTVGLAYNQTGSIISSNSKSLIKAEEALNYKLEQRFHKIALPIQVGYRFKIKKITANVFSGIRPNYFVAAKEIQSFYPTNNEITINPLDKIYFPFKVPRLVYQATAGLQLNLSKRIQLDMSTNIGSRYFYSGDPQSCLPSTFTNNDFIVGLNYNF